MPPPVAVETAIAPEITKHPGSEDKKTGESTSFIARAYPYDSVYWMAIDPNGEHVAVDSIGDKITGVTFTGTHSEQLFINNLTDAINGWKFYAVFSNNFGTTITGEAEVRVPAEPTPHPDAYSHPHAGAYSHAYSCAYAYCGSSRIRRQRNRQLLFRFGFFRGSMLCSGASCPPPVRVPPAMQTPHPHPYTSLTRQQRVRHHQHLCQPGPQLYRGIYPCSGSGSGYHRCNRRDGALHERQNFSRQVRADSGWRTEF